MSDQPIVISTPVRTAIGTFGGSLKETRATELGATTVREVLRRSKLAPDKVGTVVMGNVIQAGNKMNPARQAAIEGGIPVDVPALTVNRVCGSGAQAVVSSAQEVMLGLVECGLAGGMENMDQAPYLMRGGRWGYRLGDGVVNDSILSDGLNDAFSDKHSGWLTEDLAATRQITREDQDEWAERSQKRFAAAQAAGKFDAEIVGIALQERNKTKLFQKDEHNRPDTSMKGLSKLRPAFRKDGSITAGNAPGLNSGAAAMLISREEWAEKNGLAPMARLVSFAVAGVEPEMFGLGPVPAVKLALDRARWKLTDVERIEINEAFAAIAIAVHRQLGLPQDIVNVEGGAIAHGHPIGATGAVLTTRLLHSMKRDAVKRAVVTLCIGGGQGIALAVESVS